MRSIVDGTTAAMGVEVCSFYLVERDSRADARGHERAGSVAGREGQPGVRRRHHGRVAETRQPIAVADVTKDDRFSWVRGFDVEALAGMLSVPLDWHGEVVGVLNVQTPRHARVQRGRRRAPPDDRGAAGRDRGEGPADRGGGGAAGAADRA